MLRCSIFVLQCSVLLQCSMARAAPPDGGARPAIDARAAFDAAMDLVGRDDAAAEAKLVALADADPEGEYADDALIEAAQLDEEKLGRPARARDLYAKLLERAPGSRLALRARARLEFLD